MFIKRTAKRVGDATYVNHLLVESVATPKGPRHRVVCSLGSLAPAARDQWRGLARRLEAALGGQEALLRNDDVDAIVEQARARAGAKKPKAADGSALVTVDTERVEVEEVREAGPQHVGHQMWNKLGIDSILARAGLSARARLLSEVMTLNRLIKPLSEHAMPDWVRRSALGDILDSDFSSLNDEALYRNLDRLHPERERIERELAERERALFNLQDTIYLYDLTSTYFEGQCSSNPQAKRGYSRDKRPDCKQVVVGLVLDREGFPGR